MSRKIKAIRGAIKVSENTKESISSATIRLLRSIIEANNLEICDIISIFFTMTTDLNADFPARAAREVCGPSVPLLCAQEIEVTGSMPGVIRVLIHAETPLEGTETKHIYLDGAEQLRPDLFEKGESNER
ncbi:MAG: chorismate mutase [Planctomycetota bacterium]|nr:chorismate mutase [Planctomycetota bacterium]